MSYLQILKRLTSKQLDLYVVPMLLAQAATTTAAGLYNDVYGSTPGNCSGWSGLANVFNEYRVLAMEVMFKPIVTTLTTYVFTPLAAVIDYDSNAAETSYVGAANYSSYREKMGNRPLSITALMSGVENAQFIPTSAPVSLFYVKFLSVGNLPVSSNIGQVEVRYWVEFRGKAN